MTLQEIFALETPDKIITELKKRDTTSPDTTAINKEWDPLLHPVMDTTLRPNKKIYDESGAQVRTENVGRIPLAFQKLIVDRACSLLFGNPVTLEHNAENDIQQEIVRSIERILRSNKEVTLNRKVGRNLMAATEVAEYWYTTEMTEKANLYGFESPLKLRHHVFSPLLGDSLYPLFDDYGDLIAFSREFTRTIDQQNVYHFEVYTADETIIYQQQQSGYVELKDQRKKNLIGKIPVIYGYQGETEWNNVQDLIERLETLASNFADTNDYHASPTIVAEGEIKGFVQKGEQGKLIQVDPGAKMYYLSWDRAPESIRLERDMLVEFIYTLTQTPNITFENMKGLGPISGVALKLMFMDAHLKAEDKKEVVSDYLQRRINVLKAYLKTMNTRWASVVDSFDITPDITPYMIVDEKEQVDLMIAANGNQPVLSQKTSVEKSGLTINADQEFEQIQAESKEQNRQKSEVFNQVY